MKDNNIVYEKSLNFAVRIVKVYQFLCSEKKEYTMSKQLLRSGTSIGANISEAGSAESRPDFIHKLAISQKEAYETRYWLILLHRTGYLTEKQFQSLISDCYDLIRLLSAIAVTLKNQSAR